MTVKKNQNVLRNTLLESGNVRATHTPVASEFRHKDSKESQAVAIAVRRAELNRTPVVQVIQSLKGKQNGA